ncbi:MAG: SsrA-binding protein SmpB [Ignavibacteriales bacterium]|nr:SsrA-binding protein SmpB [Ignavibacteriales bacterium]MCB9209806.1 SsrA-binding protein SmpB [Ignavibacteriales bacterium]MCB9218962.1 SsrA-binding protein SmpB [Ignavibacteriales bacterium]
MNENPRNITVNRKARHDYTILQSLEAGIVLVGTEVKSCREHKASLVDSYAKIDSYGEVWLIGAHINVYKQGNRFNHDPIRDRKLLLSKKEIRKLDRQIKEKGNTLIPLSMYFSKGKVKVELAVAKGKKSFDKREAIAKKDMQREAERKIKL